MRKTKCLTTGCNNEATVIIGGLPSCTDCANSALGVAESPVMCAMNSCTNVAKPGSLVCFECKARIDALVLSAAKQDSIRLGDLLMTPAKQAIWYIDQFIVSKALCPQPTTPARALARLAIVLYPYGASARTLLNAVHDLGWTEITIDDAVAVFNHFKTKV